LVEAALRTALDALLAHHDALRLRFERVDGQWRQDNAPPELGIPVSAGIICPMWTSLSCRPPWKRSPTRYTRASISPAARCCGQCCSRRVPAADPYLLLVAHHLAVDGVSWRILLDDLDTAYGQALRGEPVDLGPKTTSFRDWACRLDQYVAAGGLDGELEHWADRRGARLAHVGQVGSAPGTGRTRKRARLRGAALPRPPAVCERLAAAGPGPQVVFNYLGQWDAQQREARDGLYYAVHASLGQDHDPADRSSTHWRSSAR
jgi:hypothetical protein